MQDMKTYETAGRFIALKARVLEMGNDLCISVTGGDRPHLGSASVSVPRPSMADPLKISSTTSTINITGHKDDSVSNKISARISSGLNVNTAVICGIHIDDISPDVINEALELAEELAEMIVNDHKR